MQIYTDIPEQKVVYRSSSCMAVRFMLHTEFLCVLFNVDRYELSANKCAKEPHVQMRYA